LIALSVPDEERLISAYEKITSRGIKAILFREPDRDNEATALCTEPVYGNVRKIFSKYPLWREK
jgi:hypothetical protein